MRSVSLGQWLYFAWHLPTLLITTAAAGIALWNLRVLLRDDLPLRARHLRWTVTGWASVFASLLSVVVWPYLHAVSSVAVAADGRWSLRNYLGMEIGAVAPDALRSLRAYDLGGLRWGAGHVEFARADGVTYATVRIGGATFQRLCDTLGYTRAMLREHGGVVVVPAHRFTASGPSIDATVASR